MDFERALQAKRSVNHDNAMKLSDDEIRALRETARMKPCAVMMMPR